ncbi:MAG: AAA family ATPase [Armatimonadetes bacterium CG_4_10_14_3_um_filter_66_18]|nr:MAG: AAA family ATPase [Armatimonadetes bacterium CG_4_10_14_3_um_filter_66_18]
MMDAAIASAVEVPGVPPLDDLREWLGHLGLTFAADLVKEELHEAVRLNRAPHEVLGRLLRGEIESRDERRVRTALKLSNLPGGTTLGNFDFAFQPGVDRRQVEGLATCEFVREHTNVLLQGPPGVGKTHLAVALGVRAIEQGFGVIFYRLEEMLHELRRDLGAPPAKLRRRKCFSASLLIVDEMGFEPMDREQASLFFRLVSYRYQRGSTIITTNKSVKDWPGILAGDEAMTAAILDRLLHRCAVLNIRGRSYRLQEIEQNMNP